MNFSFAVQDIFIVGFLIFLEGILSIDNAVVLAVMVKHLPPDKRKKALTYGLAGAFFFRLIALSLASQLIQWTWVKFVGGGYLIYIALKHLLSSKTHEAEQSSVKGVSFWKTVALIELMDLAFAIDSILAAVAVSPKLWVVYTGGMIGVIVIRFAASFFSKLLEKHPTLENTAYQLVMIIGVKLTLEGFHFPWLHFTDATNPAFWIFWGSMTMCIVYGFLRNNKKTTKSNKHPKNK